MASRYHFGPAQPTIGGTIGSALGTGLGAGLTRLAESKLDTMLNRQKHGQLTAEFVKMGIPEEQASFLAKQSPETQWQVVRQWWMSQGYDAGDLPGSVHEDWESGSSPLQELSTQEQPMAAGPEQGAIAALESLEAQGKRPQTAADLLSQEGPLSPQVREALGKTKIERPSAIEALSPVQSPVAPQAKEAPIAPMPKQRKARDLGEAFKMAGEATPKGSKESAKEQLAINKATEPVVKEIRNGAKAAKASNIRLDRMQQLIEKGDLSYPITSSFVKTASKGIFGFGLDLSSLLTADTQEFDKLSTDFLKDAKAIFGSRITDVDLQNFLRTVPTSTMSEEGQRRVIRDLKIFNEAALLRNKVMQNIVDEYGGKRPANLEDLVEQRAEPQLESLAEKFRKGDEQREALAKKNAKKNRLYTAEERNVRPFSGM